MSPLFDLGCLVGAFFLRGLLVGDSGIILTNDELDFPYHCVPPLDLCAGVPHSPEGTPYVSGFFISLGSDLKSGTGRFD